MKKRILSIVLATVMLVSLLPLPALATGQSDLVNLPQGATALAARPEQKNSTITVVNGTATVDGTPVTSAPVGTVVTLTADPAPTGLTFDHWEVVSGKITLADSHKASTTFIMPPSETAVEIRAVYSQNITQVSIDGLAMPVLGAHPDFEAALPENAPYHLASHQELRDAMYAEEDYLPSCNGIWWIKDLFTMDPLCLTPEMTFDDPSAEAYTLLFALVPDEGYHFDDSCTVSLNGNSDLAELLDGASRADICVFSSVELTAASAYTITAEGGTASYGGSTITSAPSGAAVTLTADPAPRGQVFDHWEVVSGKITLADAHKASTTFTMPAGDVKVKAVYAKPIPQAAIANLKEPVYQFAPVFEVAIPQDAPYHLASRQEIADNGHLYARTSYGGMWWMTADGETYLTPDTPFDSTDPDAYRFRIVLVPNDGYCFTGETTAAVNGGSHLIAETALVGDSLCITSRPLTAEIMVGRQYKVTVDNGTAQCKGEPITSAPDGAAVTLTADPAPRGKVFDHWEVVSGTCDLDDPYDSSTHFYMPGEAVRLKAVYVNAITHISIDDLTLPVLGAHPDFEVSIPQNAHYRLATHDDLIAAAGPDPVVSSNYGGVWWWSTDDSDTPVTPDMTFDSPEEDAYYMQVVLCPSNGYRFAENVTVSINGTSALVRDGFSVGNVYTVFSIFLTAQPNTPDNQPAAPADFQAVVRADGKPYLTWDAVEGADGYEIQRADGQGDFQKFYTAKGTSDSLRHGSAEAGETYTYRIRTVRDGQTSAWVESKSVQATLAAPEIHVTINSKGKPVITWDKVDGAQEYEVLYGVPNASFEHLYDTPAGTRVTHGSAKNGQTYVYAVIAKANGVETRSETITVTALAAPEIQLDTRASDGKPVLTWDKVAGADHYAVYRKVGKNGAYQLLKGDVQGTSLRNGSAKAGTTYYYYVAAVSKSGAESMKSSIKYITCDLARPDVTARLKDGKPYLTWDKVPGAVKYEVYRSVNGGSYQLLATVKGTSLRNGSAKPGQTCKYRVKAICSNKYGNSALSYIDTVKVK